MSSTGVRTTGGDRAGLRHRRACARRMGRLVGRSMRRTVARLQWSSERFGSVTGYLSCPNNETKEDSQGEEDWYDNFKEYTD